MKNCTNSSCGNITPVLMFSSLTHDGARATLDALDAGAMDFLPKRFEDIARSKEEAMLLLQQRVKAIARRRSFIAPRATAPAPVAAYYLYRGDHDHCGAGTRDCRAQNRAQTHR